MKTAIIGSRNLPIDDISKYIPQNITLLISGGAKGIDILAERYADKYGIPKLIFLPDYKKYGKAAPLIRNKLIVENADIVIAVWDGKSCGTKFTINYANQINKRIEVFTVK